VNPRSFWKEKDRHIVIDLTPCRDRIPNHDHRPIESKLKKRKEKDRHIVIDLTPCRDRIPNHDHRPIEAHRPHATDLGAEKKRKEKKRTGILLLI
jgi:hypothetical protein